MFCNTTRRSCFRRCPCCGQGYVCRCSASCSVEPVNTGMNGNANGSMNGCNMNGCVNGSNMGCNMPCCGARRCRQN